MARSFADEYGLPVEREKSFAEKHGLDLSPYMDKPAPEWLAGAVSQARADDQARMLAENDPGAGGSGGVSMPDGSVGVGKPADLGPTPVRTATPAFVAGPAAGAPAASVAPPGAPGDVPAPTEPSPTAGPLDVAARAPFSPLESSAGRFYQRVLDEPDTYTPGHMQPGATTKTVSHLTPQAAGPIDERLKLAGDVAYLEGYKESRKNAIDAAATAERARQEAYWTQQRMDKIREVTEADKRRAEALEAVANDPRSEFDKMFGTEGATRALGVIGSIVSGVMSIKSGYDVMNGWLRREGEKSRDQMANRQHAYEVLRRHGLSEVEAVSAMAQERANLIANGVAAAYEQLGNQEVGRVTDPNNYASSAEGLTGPGMGPAAAAPGAPGAPPALGAPVNPAAPRMTIGQRAQKVMDDVRTALPALQQEEYDQRTHDMSHTIGPFEAMKNAAVAALPPFAANLVPGWSALTTPQMEVLRAGAERDVKAQEAAAAQVQPGTTSALTLNGLLVTAKSNLAALDHALEQRAVATKSGDTVTTTSAEHYVGGGSNRGEKFKAAAGATTLGGNARDSAEKLAGYDATAQRATHMTATQRKVEEGEIGKVVDAAAKQARFRAYADNAREALAQLEREHGSEWIATHTPADALVLGNKAGIVSDATLDAMTRYSRMTNKELHDEIGSQQGAQEAARMAKSFGSGSARQMNAYLDDTVRAMDSEMAVTMARMPDDVKERYVQQMARQGLDEKGRPLAPGGGVGGTPTSATPSGAGGIPGARRIGPTR